jgi:hypothetical protein
MIEMGRIRVTVVTIYATLFVCCLLLEDASLLWHVSVSHEPSSGDIHVVLKKIIMPTTDPLF